MIEAEDTRSISSVDPDNTASTVAFTVTDTATDAENGQIISIDYALDGTESTLTLTLVTSLTSGAGGLSGGQVGISTLTTAANLATAITTAIVRQTDFAATNADGTSTIGVASSGATITFTIGDGNATGDDGKPLDGIHGIRTNSETTEGIVVTTSTDGFDLTVGEVSVAQADGLQITAGTYATIEAYAAEIQRVIDETGTFSGENAVNVVVKEGTTDASPLEPVKYVAFENEHGKFMSIANNQLVAFGTDVDTFIDNTNVLSELQDELGLTADQTTYATHGGIDGGVDTTQDGGYVSVSIQDGENTVTKAVQVSQDATRNFADFASDLEAAINTDFAGNGYSVTIAESGGSFSLGLDQTGAKTITLSGSIINDAFGDGVSATGTDGEGAAFSSMADVAAAINEDLTAAGGRSGCLGCC